jgi:PTH1 family peptidyl-tRNA hydrolase
LKLIAGLGNPGQKYLQTRHNIGFLALDFIATDNSVIINNEKFKSFYAKTTLFDEDAVLIKPQTYMNLSGQAVSPFSNFYNIPAQDIIVIHDDIDLDFKEIRIKNGGGHGGHNGIRNIVQELGTNDFIRIRIGVGRPENLNFPIDKYVLSRFNDNEERELSCIFEYTLNACELIFEKGIKEAMNEFNGKYSK